MSANTLTLSGETVIKHLACFTFMSTTTELDKVSAENSLIVLFDVDANERLVFFKGKHISNVVIQPISPASAFVRLDDGIFRIIGAVHTNTVNVTPVIEYRGEQLYDLDGAVFYVEYDTDAKTIRTLY